MTDKKRRLCFAAAFILLLTVEVLIALFVRDSFIRPYMGDVLAVVTVYCGARIVFPQKFRWLSLAVMGLALCVELIQLTDFSSIFGEGSFMSVLLGATFDPHDLFCYAVGGVLCLACDFILYKSEKSDNKQ